MKWKNLKDRSPWLGCAAGMAMLIGGCADEQLPPSKFAGSARERMENPLGYAKKLKGIEAKETDPTKKMTPKQKAAYKNREGATDPRDLAREKLRKEQEEKK
jgi:hypothetical protein